MTVDDRQLSCRAFNPDDHSLIADLRLPNRPLGLAALPPLANLPTTGILAPLCGGANRGFQGRTRDKIS
jgi:hypothetical protein